MRKLNRRMTGAAAAGIALVIGTLHAQVGRGGSEWLTAGGDAQRTFWIRTDPRISVASMSQPGFELQWTAKLDNALRGTNGLAQGVSANGVTLFIPMSIVAGSSNNIYALDNDTGYVVWQRHFDAALPAATPQCPGGITAGATRIVPLVPPPLTTPPPAGGGRGAQTYRSVLGEPGQGVPLDARGRGPAAPSAPPGAGRGAEAAGAGAPPATAPSAAGAPAPGTPPAAGAPPGRAGGGGIGGQSGPSIPGASPDQLGGGRPGGFGRPSGVVYAVTSDGVLHVLGLPSGKDIQHPAEFVPANAKWSDTIAIDKTLYATTTGGCGGAPNAVWAVDLESEGKPVVSWTSGGPIVGRLAFASDGTVFASIGPGTGAATADGKANAIVALDPGTLKLKDWFSQPGVEFATGPVIFKHEEREIVAAATKDGRILLLDAASPGGTGHGTPLYASAPPGGANTSIATDALASWREMTITPAPPPARLPAAAAPGAAPAPAAPTVTFGTRWILAPTPGAIVAMKLVDGDGSLTLERAWTAQNLAAPETPVVVNGVVFALSTGRPQTPAGRGGAAVLHAYDATSGRELWSSGRKMTAVSSPGSFWSAFGQVYVGTNDGMLYAFGFRDERR